MVAKGSLSLNSFSPEVPQKPALLVYLGLNCVISGRVTTHAGSFRNGLTFHPLFGRQRCRIGTSLTLEAGVSGGVKAVWKIKKMSCSAGRSMRFRYVLINPLSSLFTVDFTRFLLQEVFFLKTDRVSPKTDCIYFYPIIDCNNFIQTQMKQP